MVINTHILLVENCNLLLLFLLFSFSCVLYLLWTKRLKERIEKTHHMTYWGAKKLTKMTLLTLQIIGWSVFVFRHIQVSKKSNNKKEKRRKKTLKKKKMCFRGIFNYRGWLKWQLLSIVQVTIGLQSKSTLLFKCMILCLGHIFQPSVTIERKTLKLEILKLKKRKNFFFLSLLTLFSFLFFLILSNSCKLLTWTRLTWYTIWFRYITINCPNVQV